MPRGLLIFALCLPLAILMGFMVADPMVGSNRTIIGAALLSLLIPIILSVHQRALIWIAGAFISAYFLPGQPQIWMLVAGLSLGISVLSWPLRKVKVQPVWDKAVLVTFAILIAVIALTALKSGGIGLRVLGSSMYGGRKYVALIGSFIGFLALTLQPLPRKFAQKDLTIFALAPATSAVSNVAYMLGPAFYFLFLLFPVEMALTQAHADMSPLMGGIKRYSGFSNACTAISMFCLLRWGIKGTLQPNKPWRLGLLVFGFCLGMLSGFRSAILIPVVVMIAQFFTEGLHKTKYALGLTGVIATSVTFLAVFSESLPLAAQRAISFLPVRVDPVAAMDASNSLEWRVSIWKLVIKDVPGHLWFGRGYAIDPVDIYLAEESVKRGFQTDYELSAKSGDYHSGPLSVLVPFGLIGTLALVLFVIAAMRTLYRNFKYGDADLKNINTFLLSYFIGEVVYFIFFFGGIEVDLWVFASTVGISLAVNGGPKRAAKKPRLKMQLKRGKLASQEEPALVGV